MKIKLKFGDEILSLEFEAAECDGSKLKDVIKEKLCVDDFHLLSVRGVDLKPHSKVSDLDTFLICPKVLGGKGGFGSLLRSFGKQITKSTDKGACRDLTGRRIRTVNREKRMKEFLAKQEERARQKEIEKKEKREKRKRDLEKKHDFHDPKYDKQKEKIAEDIEEALNIGLANGALKRSKSSDEEEPTPVEAKKAKDDETKAKPLQKMNDWLGVELDSDDESDSEEPSTSAKA